MQGFDYTNKKTGFTFYVVCFLIILDFGVNYFGKFVRFILENQFGDKISKYTKGEIPGNLNFLLAQLVVCFVGFKLLKYNPLRFKKTDFSIKIASFVIGVSWFYISPLIIEIFPVGNGNMDNSFLFYKGVMYLFTAVSFFFIQIGLIGHGLLKNYGFSQVLIMTMASSIILIYPQPVLLMACQGAILFVVYYLTSSFQLPLIIVIVSSLTENILRGFGAEIQSNYIKSFFTNQNYYAVGLLLAIITLLISLIYIFKHKTTLDWYKPQFAPRKEFTDN